MLERVDCSRVRLIYIDTCIAYCHNLDVSAQASSVSDVLKKQTVDLSATTSTGSIILLPKSDSNNRDQAQRLLPKLILFGYEVKRVLEIQVTVSIYVIFSLTDFTWFVDLRCYG